MSPPTSSPTTLSTPRSCQSTHPGLWRGGVEALCLRLRDETTRHRIAAEIEGREPLWPPWWDGWAHNLIRAGGWDNVFVLQAANPAYSRWLGRSLSAVAAAEGSSPFECAARLTQACGGDMMARYHGVTGAPGDDGRLRSLIAHPDNAIGVDVILNGDGVSHPRRTRRDATCARYVQS